MRYGRLQYMNPYTSGDVEYIFKAVILFGTDPLHFLLPDGKQDLSEQRFYKYG